jgi:anti-anti-sigma factor
MDNPQASHTVEVRDGKVVVALAGEVDLAIENHVAAWLSEAISEHPGMDFEVDLEEVEFLDSSGIRALLNAHHTVTAKGGTFRLARAQGTVREVLEIVDVYDLLSGPLPEEPAV